MFPIVLARVPIDVLKHHHLKQTSVISGRKIFLNRSNLLVVFSLGGRDRKVDFSGLSPGCR